MENTYISPVTFKLLLSYYSILKVNGKLKIKQQDSQFFLDSALNMVGKNIGFTTLFKKKIGKPNLLVNNCMAHKLEIIIKRSLKFCKNCKTLAAFVHALYAFYSQSPKRKDSLKAYCSTHGKKLFTPRKVLDVRWSPSHFEAYRVVYINYGTLLGHLESIFVDPNFSLQSDKNTKDSARELIKIMKKKHFVSTLGLQLDMLYTYKVNIDYLK